MSYLVLSNFSIEKSNMNNQGLWTQIGIEKGPSTAATAKE